MSTTLNNTSDRNANHDRGNRWFGQILVAIAILNLPVGVWLALFAPLVPKGMVIADLPNASTELQIAFLMGGRGSLSVVFALATAMFVVVIGGKAIIQRWKA